MRTIKITSSYMAQTNLATISEAKLQAKIDKYFEKHKKGIISMTGLALHLGVTRKTLANYSKTDRVGHLIEMAKLRCENLLEERMIQGVPPTGMIFTLKNNYGWVDKTEVDQNIKGTVSLTSLFDKAQQVKEQQAQIEEPRPIEGEVVEEATDEDELFTMDTKTEEKLPNELF